MITDLPNILQYFIPGVWCIILYNFIFSKKLDIHANIVSSVVISYLLLSIISLLRTLTPLNLLPNAALLNSCMSFIIGTVLTISLALFCNTKLFRNFTINLFHKTISTNIWNDVLDYKNGSNLKVYVKNKDYYIVGQYLAMEEDSSDPWLAMSSFGKYDKISNDPYNAQNHEPNFIDDNTVKIVIRFSEIEHIEIF